MVKLPSGVKINDLVDDLRDICWEASHILLYYSKKIKDINYKNEIIKYKKCNDPVTSADLEVNDTVLKKLNEIYPSSGWNFLSEENTKLDLLNDSNNFDWLWILDPLDGTRDFIQGTRNYAIHLGLNYKNKPFLGCVVIPEKNELWISDSKSVWCEKSDGSLLSPKLSKNNSLNQMNLVTSKNHANCSLKKLIESICFKKVVKMGSVGCKIASILRGENDIYISLSLPGQSSPKDWDFAAPEAILKTAGGQITYLNNKELKYNQINNEQRGLIIASNNKHKHEIICSQIKKIIKEREIYPLDF